MGGGLNGTTSRAQSGQNVGPDLPTCTFNRTGVALSFTSPAFVQKQSSAGYPVFFPLCGDGAGVGIPGFSVSSYGLPVSAQM